MNFWGRMLLALGLAAIPNALNAQGNWPDRPVTLVVPYAPGGYTDLTARLTARYLEKAFGKSVVVENRPGAGGIVGTQAVVNAAPDGYTFCVCSVGAVSVAPFAQKVGYDPANCLARSTRWVSQQDPAPAASAPRISSHPPSVSDVAQLKACEKQILCRSSTAVQSRMVEGSRHLVPPMRGHSRTNENGHAVAVRPFANGDD